MLLLFVHTRSERSSCVTNENREHERKVQTLLIGSPLHTGQSLHDVGVNVELSAIVNHLTSTAKALEQTE